MLWKGPIFLLLVLHAYFCITTGLLWLPQAQQLLKLPPTYVTSSPISGDFYAQDEDLIFSKSPPFTTLAAWMHTDGSVGGSNTNALSLKDQIANGKSNLESTSLLE